MPDSEVKRVPSRQPPRPIIMQRTKISISSLLSTRNYVQGPILERRERSTISLATHEPTKRLVTLKTVSKSSTSSEEIEACAMRELGAHPGVLSLLDFLQSDHYYVFVVQYCNGGDILSLLCQTSLTEGMAARIFARIADAISYAHKNGWVHRDIKPENIFWHKNKNGNIEVYLADWGSAMKCASALVDDVAGTEGYAAPEVFIPTRPYNPFLSDVWSLGATLYVLWMERFPFETDYPRHHHGSLTMPKHASPELEELLRGCLFVEPITRFNIDDVLRCNWLRMHSQGNSILYAVVDVAIEGLDVIS